MKRIPRLAILAMILGLASGAIRAQDRVALVIGNDRYAEGGNFPALQNCAADAVLIRHTLAKLGFRIFHAENATRSEMDAALADFENAIPRGGTAVFYFAGHGIEFDGKNYLMGTNAKLQARSRLGEEAMDAETFASAMIVAGAKSSFLFLDCCRDAPADAAWLTRGTKKRGLAELNIDGDIIIAYAAKPGQAALDGRGGNSPYATALSRWLPSAQKHSDLFAQVRLEVHQTTGGAQRTWESGSFLEPFYFNPEGDAAPSPAKPTIAVAAPGRTMAGPNPEAMERFRRALSAAVKKSPNPPPGSKSSEQMRQFRSLAQDLVTIETAGLPSDLAEAFGDFRGALKRTSAALAQFPGLNWDDAKALAEELGRSDAARAETLASVPDLARECQAAGTRIDELLARYGLAID